MRVSPNAAMIAFLGVTSIGAATIGVLSETQMRNAPIIPVSPAEAVCLVDQSIPEVQIVSSQTGRVIDTERYMEKWADYPDEQIIHYKTGPEFARGVLYTIDFNRATCLVDNYGDKKLYQLANGGPDAPKP